jgi:hypothetical protein
MNDDEQLSGDLRALPAHDVTSDVARRVRRQALMDLGRQRAYRDRPWPLSALGGAAALWSRVIMPIALASVVGVYLTWAFEFAGALYR